MNKKKKDDNHTEQWVKDAIIDDMITKLLRDAEYYPKIMPGHKYNLDVPYRHLYFEHRFRHGVKDLESAGVSMFEAEELKDGSLNLIGSFVVGRNFIRVNLSGLKGEYYLHVGELIRFFRQGAEGGMFKLSANEVGFVLLNIDREFLLKNCRQRQK